MWRCGAAVSLFLVTFVVWGSAAVPSDAELACSDATFPCFRARYVDLVLDFIEHDRFTVPPIPSGSAYRSHSAFADALQGQAALPILNALCLTPTSTVTDDAATTASTTTLSTMDASVLASVRTFSDYQQTFASQSVSVPSTSASTTAAHDAATMSARRQQLHRLFDGLDGSANATGAPSPPAGAPLTSAVCQPVAYQAIVDGAQGTITNSSITAIWTTAPGARLMPFRSNGGRVHLPYGTNQYLVTLAILGTGTQAKGLYDVFAAFAIAEDAPADRTAELQALYFYRCCGLHSVHWLDTSQYEALYLNPNADAAPSLFAPVGFGGAISDGLSVSWVLLLVVGTCLAGILVYALCVRRQADAARAAVDADDKGAGGDGAGGGGGDDGEVATDDDEELQLTEADQLIEHNMTTVWQERDLKAELNESVRQKATAKDQAGLGLINGVTDEAGNARALVPLHDDGHGATSVVRRGAGRRGFARVQLLPTSSLFEEAFETSADFALPPEADDQDEAAFQARLKKMQARDQVRRRREEEAVLSLVEMQRAATGGVASGSGGPGLAASTSPSQPAKGSVEDLDALMALPPEAIGGLDATWDGQGDEAAAALQKQQQEEAEQKKPKPLGLAARRMATMMGNMKFAAVPSGVLRLPSRHELVGQLAGGSAASHLAMTAEADDATERLLRTRFSKLYFAPQALVDQPAYDSDDSEGSPSNSPRARGPARHQEIFKNLESSSASPQHNRRSVSGSPQPPRPPPRPLREPHDDQQNSMNVEL